jgi:phospholipase A1
MKKWIWIIASGVTALAAVNVQAQELSDMQQCLLDEMNSTKAETTIADVRSKCEEKLRSADDEDIVEVDAVEEPGALTSRMKSEQVTQFDPYVLTPHRRNYLLPVITSTACSTPILKVTRTI